MYFSQKYKVRTFMTGCIYLILQMPAFKRATVILFGSSHGCSWRHLPGHIRDGLPSLGPKYSWFLNYSESGATLTENRMAHFRRRIAELGGAAGQKVIIFLLGGNDLRPGPRGKNDGADVVVAKFAVLIEFAAQFKNIKLIISAIVPQLHQSDPQRQRFIDCTFGLRDLCALHDQATFFNLAKHLLYKGEPKSEFWADDVHLNDEGALLVANHLLEVLRQLEPFG